MTILRDGKLLRRALYLRLLGLVVLPVFASVFLFPALSGAAELPTDQAKNARASLPVELSQGLMGWYDAGDDASLTVEGATVTAWKDRSPAGHDLNRLPGINGPLRAVIHGVSVVESAGNRALLSAALDETTEAVTVQALIKTAPGLSPILSFNTQGKPEFVAAGWTTGARPTFYSASGNSGAQQEVEDSQWHILTFIRDKSTRRFYVDGVFAGEAKSKDETLSVSHFHLFAYHTAATFQGKLAELLIFRAAQTPEEVAKTTAYLREKWKPLFAANKSTLTTFVGNSMTTGMFSGSGKTWSYQTAGQLPAMTRWFNVSLGGITTQRLQQLAPQQIDGLLSLTSGNAVLVFWEGTNDLVVNKSDAEAAHEAIKQFCLARRKAGWKKIVVLTVLPRKSGADFETRRIKLNQLLREHFAEYSDALVDLDNSHLIGDNGNQDNREYFVDGVHLSAKGNEIVAGLVAAKLAPLVAP